MTSKPTEEEIVQVWMVTYIHSCGGGRFLNYRTDNQPPSHLDIESMEEKISKKNGLKSITVSGIYRLADCKLSEVNNG
ncbi:Uncharacterised protein [Yersinia enterocolitica]|uniref:Uncharacterized protein n=1 Tax=Yersinia enterocolitica TaxID=630 RepID=A0A9P1V923_YEREN|nr:hypothetical protein [Yersinia enterocolitica]CNF21783.1 Uncharacterised protein [Yersinia enterocolitica]CNG10426.1 Uncharacterised protein [Yersinia enterocolitica]